MQKGEESPELETKSVFGLGAGEDSALVRRVFESMTTGNPLQSFAGKRVLVTGAAGFIGQNLVRALEAAGSKVLAADLAGTSPFGPQIPYTVLEFCIPSGSLKAVLDFHPDYVVHLACPPDAPQSPESEKLFLRWAGGTAEFFSGLSRMPSVQGVVTIGSSKEYGNGPAPFKTDQALKPLSAYGAAKAAVTGFANYFRATCGLQVSVLRLATVYGPGQPSGGIVDAAVRSAVEKKDLKMTRGEQIREFLYVEDAVAAILRSLSLAKDPECALLQIGGGEPVKLLDLVRMIFDAGGAKCAIEAGAIPYRDSEVFDMRMDSSLFKKKSGWAPAVSLREGLQRTLDWYKARA
jgi:nucleoside-diphosphate-sugar epimerase